VTTIEAIARALCVADTPSHDPDALVIPGRILSVGAKGYFNPPYADYANRIPAAPIPSWHLYQGQAYAALTALREPTDSVKSAAHGFRIEGASTGFDAEAVDVLRAMIDAILNEKESDHEEADADEKEGLPEG
jgi:hypothetical protein